MKKRSVKIAGHDSSVTLEDEFWRALKEIAAQRGQSINQIVTDIDAGNPENLSSAIRVFVLTELQRALKPD